MKDDTVVFVRYSLSLSISAHGNSTFWSRMYSYVKIYYVLFSHLYAGVSTGQKNFPPNTNTTTTISYKFFSSFNHGSIVSVGMKNKAFLSVFAPDIFHSVR
jgi:hypothetical protein